MKDILKHDYITEKDLTILGAVLKHANYGTAAVELQLDYATVVKIANVVWTRVLKLLNYIHYPDTLRNLLPITNDMFVLTNLKLVEHKQTLLEVFNIFMTARENVSHEVNSVAKLDSLRQQWQPEAYLTKLIMLKRVYMIVVPSTKYKNFLMGLIISCEYVDIANEFITLACNSTHTSEILNNWFGNQWFPAFHANSLADVNSMLAFRMKEQKEVSSEDFLTIIRCHVHAFMLGYDPEGDMKDDFVNPGLQTLQQAKDKYIPKE